jgi:hypothetical protein
MVSQQILPRLLVEKGIFTKEEFLEMVKVVDRGMKTKGKMIAPKRLFTLTMSASFLFGILLPLILGIKDIELVAVIFCAFWFIYAFLLLVTTFLFRPSLRIKVSRQNGVSVARYELRNRETKNGKGQRQDARGSSY